MPRPFAFPGRARRINGGDFIGAQGAVVERHLVQAPFQLAIPVSFMGGSKIKRQRAIILREAHVGLALQLAVDIELHEIGPAHGRNVVPHGSLDQGHRQESHLLPGGRADGKHESVTIRNPEFLQ